MTDRPILFSAPMVRAILDGRKTQTRRIVKSPWKKREIVNLRYYYNDNGYTWSGEFDDPRSWGIPNIIDQDPLSIYDMACPYGRPGDRLTVRETWASDKQVDHIKPRDLSHGEPIYYAASDGWLTTGCQPIERGRLRPSIFMMPWMSRIILEITNVRVERLKCISEADALAEGGYKGKASGRIADSQAAMMLGQYEHTAINWYRQLWQRINGPESWTANPWVWVIEFKRVQP